MEPAYKIGETLLKVNNINLSFRVREEVTIEKKKKDKIVLKKKTMIVEKKILSDVNFEINDIIVEGRTQGQVVALVGISGKGKTQLLRILAGLTHLGPVPKMLAGWQRFLAALIGHKDNATIATGEVLVGQEQKAVKEGDMGIIFQEYYMPEWLRIKTMLFRAAAKNPLFKNDSKVIEAAVTQIMTEFELIDHINKFPCLLSGGQRQRANIAMQLLNGSNFILMDEPYSGLDPLMIDKITNLLRRVSLSDELKTFIIVSHDLENCIAIADTVYILSDKGREPGTGATIIKTINLIERDLAWHPDVKRFPAFHDTIAEVKSLLA